MVMLPFISVLRYVVRCDSGQILAASRLFGQRSLTKDGKVENRERSSVCRTWYRIPMLTSLILFSLVIFLPGGRYVLTLFLVCCYLSKTKVHLFSLREDRLCGHFDSDLMSQKQSFYLRSFEVTSGRLHGQAHISFVHMLLLSGSLATHCGLKNNL